MNYLNHSTRTSSEFFIESMCCFSLSLSLRLSNQTMNTTQAWYQWCKEHQPTIDVDDPNIASDACLWHINVHACAIGRSVQYCGPW